MQREDLIEEMEANPHLERALATKLVAMGYVVSRDNPLYEQLEQVPQHILGGLRTLF